MNQIKSWRPSVKSKSTIVQKKSPKNPFFRFVIHDKVLLQQDSIPLIYHTILQASSPTNRTTLEQVVDHYNDLLPIALRSQYNKYLKQNPGVSERSSVEIIDEFCYPYIKKPSDTSLFINEVMKDFLDTKERATLVNVKNNFIQRSARNYVYSNVSFIDKLSETFASYLHKNHKFNRFAVIQSSFWKNLNMDFKSYLANIKNESNQMIFVKFLRLQDSAKNKFTVKNGVQVPLRDIKVCDVSDPIHDLQLNDNTADQNANLAKYDFSRTFSLSYKFEQNKKIVKSVLDRMDNLEHILIKGEPVDENLFSYLIIDDPTQVGLFKQICQSLNIKIIILLHKYPSPILPDQNVTSLLTNFDIKNDDFKLQASTVDNIFNRDVLYLRDLRDLIKLMELFNYTAKNYIELSKFSATTRKRKTFLEGLSGARDNSSKQKESTNIQNTAVTPDSAQDNKPSTPEDNPFQFLK